MRTLAIGDIHTKTWILYEIEKIIDKYDSVVFLGDYADNWNAYPEQTIATWKLLKHLTEQNPKVRAVIGNHDYAYVHSEIAGHSSGWNAGTFALLNKNKKLKDWLLTLPVTIEVDGVTYSHAGVTEQWNGDQTVNGLWNDASPIWARPREFGGNITYKNIPQVIGHNTSPTIWKPHPQVWCIDTFSQFPDKSPAGDQTVLEITDGKDFNVVKLDELLDNSNTSGVQTQVS